MNITPALPTINSPHHQLPASRRPTKELKFGSVTIPYQEYRCGSRRYWMLFYYQGGRRQRENRSSFAALKQRAEVIATGIANGQTAMSEFTAADRARYLVICQNFATVATTPENGSAEYAAMKRRLTELDVSFDAIATFWSENRPRGFEPRPLPQLIAEFLAEKQGEISRDHHAHLEQQLGKLAAHYTGPMHALQSADIITWLRGLGVGARSRHNYRAALDQLARWGQARGYLPRTWSEMERVPDPGQKTGEIKILTPEQMTRLITARQHAEECGKAQQTLVPFLALQAYAGIRHEDHPRSAEYLRARKNQILITTTSCALPPTTNACVGYINKLVSRGATNSPVNLILSANAHGYGNTNYVVDNVRHGSTYYWDNYAEYGNSLPPATNGLIANGASPSAIIYADGLDEITNTTYYNGPHIMNAANVAGYVCWGLHSALGNGFPGVGGVVWVGNSGWWVIETLESYNGQPCGGGMSDFCMWFSSNAFGGADYSNTPIGAVTHVDEPYSGYNDPYHYFGLWEAGKNFGICAWNSARSSRFQAVGDPFVAK